MKTTLDLGLALVALASASAQVSRPAPGHAVAPGPPASVAHDGRDRRRGSIDVYRGHDHGRFNRGYDFGRSYRGYGYGGYYYGAPSFSYYAGYGDGYPYYDAGSYGSYGLGSGASNGLLLGALAGGIIGNNSGEFRHHGWRGAAWGAGLGWLLGSVADANRRAVAYSRTPVVVSQAAVTAPAQPVAQPAPPPITIINNYYHAPSPMSAANGLFGR